LIIRSAARQVDQFQRSDFRDCPIAVYQPESAFSTRRGSPAVAGIRRHAAREKPSPSIGSNLSQADTPAGRFDSLIRIKAG